MGEEITKTRAYRHGDVAFLEVAQIPEGLEVEKEGVILRNSSGGNPHLYQGGTYYLNNKEDIVGSSFCVIGYLKAKDTKLLHVEHGEVQEGNMKVCTLPDGTYEVRRQVEITPEGMRPVMD